MQQFQKETQQQTIPAMQSQQNNQQQKTTIYIENLDQGISEDYLYRKFKEIGEIQSLKITKDKSTQKSKGQAFITFIHPDQAEEARKKLNNQIFIRNIIRVKPYFNFHGADKKANIFIHNLPEDADDLELEQEFSRFGTVLSVDVHRDSTGKQLNYGYVQFERKDDAENLIKRIQNHPIIHKGKLLKLEQFKAQSERKVESTSIYLRAFASQLPKEMMNHDIAIRSFEYGWSLVIKDYLIRIQGDQVKDCFVKIDQVTRQPWAMITFDTYEQAKVNLDICENQRKHPCFNSSAHNAFELIKKHGPPANSDGSLSFTVQQITPFFEQMIKDPFDTFKGISDNFFYNMVYSKHLNPDERLIIIQNIKEDVTQEQIIEFLGQFGKIIRLTVRKTKNPKFQVQQCFVHYQTMEDSKRARSELYDDSNQKIVNQRKKIFKDGHAVANILLSKAMRKEFKDIKKQSQNIFTNPGGRSLLQPQIPNFIMPPQMPNPYPHQRRNQPGGFKYPFPPQNRPINKFLPIIKPNELIKPVEKQQPTFLQEFMDYQTVQNRMEDFLKIPTNAQRQVLGNLLFQRVFDIVKEKEITKKVVGMLIDPSQFEIGDILNMFEDSSELQTYIDEGLQLIRDEQKAN
ncbi:unnamed protein product [Paramecium sonneborni]|uniref:Polyadenylate-binding protein n=1 Tax=Paramecium sonneborni TaxID=65129 RepID=A0A8S1LIY6_9CILI|nr:unnamed protein product [Paramecium sonneborni]